MRTASGTSSLPIDVSSSTASASSESTPPKSDSSASFHDVLQQEGGDSSEASSSGQSTTTVSGDASAPAPTTAASTVATAPADKTTAAATDGTDALPSHDAIPAPDVPAKAATPATKKPTSENIPLASPTALSAMIVQAAAQLATAKQTTATKATEQGTASPSDSTTSKGDPSILGNLDLTALIAQAAKIAANGPQTPAAKTTTGPVTTKTANASSDSSTSATATNNAAMFMSSGPDLSTLIAQAAILSANGASQNGATAATATTVAAAIPALNMMPGSVTAMALTLGKEIPARALSKSEATTATKEKKSDNKGEEGTFLHLGTAGTTTPSSTFNLLATGMAATNQSPFGEQLAGKNSLKNLSTGGVSGTANGIDGTANVEKSAAMNATLNSPEIFAGTNSVPQQTPVDMQIKLSSNHDFEDALKQVMHVAQLTLTSPTSRAPMRVEMEIQTPPGAIVNVYVSKQNDQWRAQLSTNDPQALAWVQDKMSSLRGSTDLGVTVRWLPPQMESITTSGSSSESGLNWDRGGQQPQQNNQPQDEQQPSGRQKRAELYAGIGVGQFMEALTAVGSAA